MGYYSNKAKEFYEQMVKENGVHKIPSKEEFKALRNKRAGYLALPIEREVVESGRIDEVVKFFTNIKATKGYFRERVLFSISGYDEDRRELFEIEEVMKWTRKVVEAIPYIFYYIHQDSWAFIICSLGERLTVVKPKDYEQFDMEEISRRHLTGEELPRYQSRAEVKLETRQHVLQGIKRFGHEIGDMKNTLNLILYIGTKLPLLEEGE